MQTVSPATTRAIYRATLLAFGLTALALVFHAVIGIVLLVLLVVIVAIPLATVASWLERLGVRRALGALLGLLGGVAILAGVVALLVPPFVHEVNHFIDTLPSTLDRLRRDIAHISGSTPNDVDNRVQHFLHGYTRHPARLLGPAASVGLGIAGVLAGLIVVVLIAFFAAARPEPLVGGVLRLFPPGSRERAAQVLARLAAAYVSWLRGLAVGMTVLGVATYVGLRLVDLPFAIFFATLTAIAIVVPYYGAIASSVPPILYALTISPGKAAVVAAIYVGAHQVEGNLITPLVMARALDLHPAVVAVGVIASERLFGVLGLLLAVPLTGTVRILIEELWVRRLERPPERRRPPPVVALSGEAQGGEPRRV